MTVIKYFLSFLIATLSLSSAQLFSNNKKTDEKIKSMQTQIDQINSFNQANAQSLNEVKAINEKFKQHQADTSVLIEDLRNEIQILKGEIEFFKRQMEIFEENQKNFFKDAQFRLNEMESNPSAKENSNNTSSNAPNNSNTKKQSAQQAYDQALSYYQKDKNYPQAISAFENFIQLYPKDKLAANAYYWMGESYFALGKFARAIKTFDIVAKQYASSSKKCAALFMQGKGFEALKKSNEAKLFYSEVVSQCPNTDVATKASKQLN
ncbi:MAG TPA: tol-pal system protein YbgF [Oligoflexia bacterium]|nr:tol-pal system protein YbgF [Oligoflexia bacterium]HMR25125.1 tol-pal system protein YbgF [Oligoflexia bacterium]